MTLVSNENILVETEQIIVKIDKICPVCNIGRMRPANDAVLTSMPPKYFHKCTEFKNGCDHSEFVSGVRYPLIEYRDKPESNG